MHVRGTEMQAGTIGPRTRRRRNERQSCLACGARVRSGEPTIWMRGAVVHLRRAVDRRRLAPPERPAEPELRAPER